jgi:prepilin-type N-terminal cleavage/methylation domain-containing protein
MMRRGFSLVELILAIFILGIGMISVAALFPAGIIQQQYAEDDVYGPIVAKHALSVLRTRLGQEDFGTFEEFTPVGASNIVRDPVPLNRTGARSGPPTVSGDWTWKRPGLCVDDNPATAGVDEAGMYDIFSLLHTAQQGNRALATPLARAGFGRQLSDVPSGIPYSSSSTDFLYGIPYNRARYDQKRDTRETNHVWTFGSRPAGTAGTFTGSPPRVGDATNPNNGPVEPGIFFTQRERYWPQPAEGTGRVDAPRYVWDCMFRRLNGKVQVAIFVYRVAKLNSSPNAAGTPYVTVPLDARADADFGSRLADRPPIPHWVSSRAGSLSNLRRTAGEGLGNPWGAGGLDAKPGSTLNSSKYGPGLDDSGVPGTGPVSATDDSSLLGLGYSDQWQSGGQWLVDFYGNVHHVVSGRNTIGDGPVFLARPVPLQPFSEALFDVDNSTIGTGVAGGILALPQSGGDAPNGIQDLWFVPRWDANDNDLMPVYATVEEL